MPWVFCVQVLLWASEGSPPVGPLQLLTLTHSSGISQGRILDPLWASGALTQLSREGRGPTDSRRARGPSASRSNSRKWRGP